MRAEMDQLLARIGELEMANKKHENLAGERPQQLQFEIELKEQKIQVLQDQIKEKQIEFRDKNLQLEEELEIERENGVKLTKVRAQRDSYQETIQRM